MVFKNGTEWAWKNPASAACAVAVAGGATLIAAPGAISTIVLSAVGFTGAGGQSGSLAAVAQSSIGNVAAGSIFAALQSAGTGGAALGIMNGVIASAAYAKYLVSNKTSTSGL